MTKPRGKEEKADVMTVGQEDILKFIATHYRGATATITGSATVKATTQNGKEMYFTMNIYEDILDATTMEVVAVSDLPHDLDKIRLYARPGSWTLNPAYNGGKYSSKLLYNALIVKDYTEAEAEEAVIRYENGMEQPEEVAKDIKDITGE